MGAHNHLDRAVSEINQILQTGELAADAWFASVLEHSIIPYEALKRFAQEASDSFDPWRGKVSCPILLIRGTEDTLAQDAEILVDAVVAAHQPVELFEVPARDHVSVLTSGLARQKMIDFLALHTR